MALPEDGELIADTIDVHPAAVFPGGTSKAATA